MFSPSLTFLLRIFTKEISPSTKDISLSQLESSVSLLNSSSFPLLSSLSSSDFFSKVSINFYDKCPRIVDGCSVTSCEVPTIKYKNKQGIIDLLRVQESYSPTIRASSEVWRDMYKEVREYGEEEKNNSGEPENNNNNNSSINSTNINKSSTNINNKNSTTTIVINNPLTTLLSGLHFSVSTHIAYFHTNILNHFFPNPSLFQSNYSPEYKWNFLVLYRVIREAVKELKNNKGIEEVDKEARQGLNELISTISDTEDTSFNTEDASPSNTNTFSNGINISLSSLITLPDISALDHINSLFQHIACLNCQKCILWGTIQTRGLKTAVKILNGKRVYGSDVICLINLFRRLSETERVSMRMLRTGRVRAIMYSTVAQYKGILKSIGVITAGTYIITRVLRHRNKQQ